MKTNILQTLALIKSNWKEPEQKDYLDIFLPILVECIYACKNEIVESSVIQSSLKDIYGISLPENVILTILKKAKTKKLLISENKILKKSNINIDNYRKKIKFTETQSGIVGKCERLLTNLYNYAIDKFSVDWEDKSEAENELLAYLDTHGFLILSSLTSGVPLAQILPKKKKSKYGFIIASFVLHIEKNEDELFSYFESIVQGNMLASSVYLPDTSRVYQKLDATSFYFDTSFIIFALGYAGVPRQNACTELLDLLFQSGANIYCFEHTLLEIEGVLSACAHSLASNNSSAPYGYSAEYFVVNNYTEDDIIMFKVQARSDIENVLRLKIVYVPEYDIYSIDEKEFDENLKSKISYKNDFARNRDVASISAIMRLRKGKTSQHLEECKAVFVTTNYGLVRVSRNYFQDTQSGDYIIPPCVTDHRLTTQIWLKMPTKAPSLSRKRIIADCFASIQPSDNFWSKFLNEIEKLKSHGNINEETYYLLRYSLDIRKSLMEKTLGDDNFFENEEFFTNATIPELLKIAEETLKDKITIKHEQENAFLRNKIEELEKTTENLIEISSQEKSNAHKVTEEINKRHHGIANHWARYATSALEIFFLLVLVVGMFYSFPFNIVNNFNSSIPKLIVISSISFLFFLTLSDLCGGSTMKVSSRKFESYVSRRIYRYLQNFDR